MRSPWYFRKGVELQKASLSGQMVVLGRSRLINEVEASVLMRSDRVRFSAAQNGRGGPLPEVVTAS